MLITEKRTAGGNFKNEYKIAEVLDFIPAPRQRVLRFIPEDDDDANE